jgi:PAS domain S-box-containing protein
MRRGCGNRTSTGPLEGSGLEREGLAATHIDRTKVPRGKSRVLAEPSSPVDEYRLLIESVQDYAIFFLDPEGRVTTWNRGAERINGYRADEIIGRHFSCFHERHEVAAGKPLEELRIAAEAGRFEEEGWRVRKDGTLFWANVLITALRGPGGELRGFGKVTRDLTTQRRAEETARELIREQAARTAAEESKVRLRESEERYRKLSRRLEVILDGVVDGITVQDQGGKIVFANDAAARSTGFETAEAMIATPVDQIALKFDLFDEQGQPFDPAKLPGRLALSGLDPEPVLVRVRDRAAGIEWWSLVRASAVPGENGRPELAVNIWHDVTSRRREEIAARSLARATTVLSQSFDSDRALAELTATLVPDLADWCSVDILEDGNVRLVSVANVDPRKAEVATALRHRYPELRSASKIAEVIRTGRSMLKSEITDADFERAITDADELAALRALQLRSLLIVPLKTSERTLGAMTLATTLSGRRYDEHDLALAEELGRRAGIAIENARHYRDAQRAIKLRDEFLSIAGHELKTPLTALDLQLQSLLLAFAKGRVDDDSKHFEERLRKTIAQSRRLGRLVHELLDVSKISSGRLVLEPEKIDMARLVEEIIERHAGELARAGSGISFEADGPTIGAWDLSRLDQVISNLLNNAIKYGTGKPIDVRISGTNDAITLSVRDHGIGITPEYQSKIFQRFERGVSERNYGGLGLGLWIVREIVLAHGGSVRVESAPGRGSTFVVVLPLSPAQRNDASVDGNASSASV